MAEQDEQTAQDEAVQDDTAQDDTAQEADATGEGQPEGSLAVAEEGAGVVAQQAAVAEEVLEAGAEGRNMRKERVGVVVSDKMEKTIVVSIERQKKHAMYQKYLNRSARKMAHDENNDADEGDTVRIVETRPISKHKRWRLVEILERAE